MTSELERLREENELLRLRVDELEAVLLRHDLPRGLWLTRRQWQVLSMLMARPLVSKADFMTALYSLDAGDPPDDGVVDVFLTRVRQELRRHGIQLRTRWGQGWWLAEDDKAKLRDLR